MAADPLEDLLRRSPLTTQQRRDLWNTYEGAQDADTLATKLQSMNIPKQVKRGLWDLKEATRPAVPAAPVAERFPTPGETAGTMLGGAVRAIPGMAMGALEAGTDMFTLPMRETAAALTGRPSPSVQRGREMLGHAQAALAPGDAGPAERLGSAVSTVPTVGPAIVGAVSGAGTIATPAYKTATQGVGSVTPQEMKAAAETGGAAVAGLAVPELAKGGAAISPATVGRVLKFTAKQAVGEILVPGKTLAGRLVTTFVTGPLMRKAGTIVQDMILEAIKKGDLPKAAETVAKVLEKNPEAAVTLTKTVAETLAAEPAAVAAATPGPLPRMRDVSPEAVAARAADRRSRQQGALAKGQKRAEASATVVSTPVVEQALATLEKRAVLPEKGNVTMPSISTKPVTQPISGRPLTPKQREMRLKQLEAAQAAGLDIWDAFGVAKDN